MRKGFTLVELSIVLVIIGLLIGGILVAQSLIDSARINRLVSDLGQYEVAINLFKQNYKWYPGDSPNFTPAGAPDNRLSAGDSNGNGEPGPDFTCNGVYSIYESFQVWAHLSQAGMLNKDYPAISPVNDWDPCGGIHNYDLFLAGEYTPYTELDSAAAEVFGRQTNRIFFTKNAASSLLRIRFSLIALDTLSIISKMGGASLTPNTIGLFDEIAEIEGQSEVGYCYDSDGSHVLCGDSSAVYGNLSYNLIPID